MSSAPAAAARAGVGAVEAALLEEFRSAYQSQVAARLATLIESSATRRWLLAPMRYASRGRRNFFRSALLLEGAACSPAPAAGPGLAACAEAGWTAALMLDDLIDGSAEREGAGSAYVAFGRARTVLAAGVVLVLIAGLLAVGEPGSLRVRLARTTLGIREVLRALWGQAGRRRVRDLTGYRRVARRVNSSLYWCLLAPHAGHAHPRASIAALRRHAAHSSVAGKMRNDLLDFWGGSTEREGLLEDWRQREWSFPVLVLLAGDLAAAERRALLDHLEGRAELGSAVVRAMFRRHDVGARSLALLAAEVAEADAALAELDADPHCAGLARWLRRWGRHMYAGAASRVGTAAATEGYS
jgi:geranylgeranyl pyrophosphate synthase